MTGGVAQLMLRSPIVLSASEPLAEVRRVFDSSHVHMVLLTTSGRVGEVLLGTLVRDDLPPAGPGTALAHARLEGRTVRADRAATDVRRAMQAAGHRRLAVVDHDGRLMGLLCLKRSGDGFCTDAGVASRRASRTGR
jgi:CBS domain-containing protein